MGRLALKEKEGWALFNDWGEDGQLRLMTPFFDTEEELARYCADNGVSAFADITATYEDWLAMIKKGSSCSVVVYDDFYITGVQAAGLEARKNSEKLSF